MLRPEQMSKVSVTGSKQVMQEVIEAVHDLNIYHFTEYDGSWDRFEPGSPMEGAETASEQLVTVRSLKTILDVSPEDAGPTRIVTEDVLAEEIESIRTRVNKLDDRRQEIKQQIREREDEIDTIEPFVELGIDFDLLHGYETLSVAVGRGSRSAIEPTLSAADTIDSFELFTGNDIIAIFARPVESADQAALTDSLVGTEFTSIDLPKRETGSPEESISEIEQEIKQLSSDLQSVEEQLDTKSEETAGFLLAAEEKLSIEVQKAEAPLSFATTESAFIAEGWIPTAKFELFKSAITAAVGDHTQIEELERAEFSKDGSDHVREQIPGGDTGGIQSPTPTADGGETQPKADGGSAVVMQNDDPPTVQDNPGLIKPFEMIVQAVNRPSYREFDPTIILFLTFPTFFGFMIGDFGYGLVYTAIGYVLYTAFEDREAIRSMGGITIAAGFFTTIFGILYGEIFGLHLIATYFWEGIIGLAHAPIEKGLSPAGIEWARGWIVVSILIGVFHLNVAWIFGFIEDNQLHDLKHAVLENGAWLLMMNGLWIWVFSDALRSTVPSFIYTTFSSEGVLPLGFSGFPAMELFTIPLLNAPMTVPLAVFIIGFASLIVGEPIEAVEFLNVLVNVLSYTRIAAVLLAKAGMAFTVNLLFFGVYVTQESGAADWHFGLEKMPAVGSMSDGHEVTEIMFGGLLHGDTVTILIGLVVLIFGHILVLALGVTSAGLQAIRLEYVEFFNKFYEGGGRAYQPFGYSRQFTTED